MQDTLTNETRDCYLSSGKCNGLMRMFRIARFASLLVRIKRVNRFPLSTSSSQYVVLKKSMILQDLS